MVLIFISMDEQIGFLIRFSKISLFIDGARWDKQSSLLIEGKLKELCPSMPVMFVKGKFFHLKVDREKTMVF